MALQIQLFHLTTVNLSLSGSLNILNRPFYVTVVIRRGWDKAFIRRVEVRICLFDDSPQLVRPEVNEYPRQHLFSNM